MNQVAEINAEIENINQTIAQVQAQIVEKQAQVEDLKENNARLIEQNLSKLRKPPSLEVQRKKIFDLNCQIQELQYVQGSLKEKLEQSNQELSEVSIRHRLDEYAKAEVYQLNLIQKAQDFLAQYVNAISELEGSKNALELLVRINGDLNGKKLVDFGVDLETVLKVFNQHLLSFNFDSNRIEKLNTSTGNLLNQLDSIHNGKRSFHNAQVQRGPTRQVTPIINPMAEARRLEASRLKSEKIDLTQVV